MDAIIDKRIKLLKLIFFTFSVMMILVIAFLVIAIVLYPGGNHINDLDNGYSFFFNTICDLQRTTAVNGESSVIGSIFMKMNTVLACIAMIGFFGTIWIFYQNKKPMKYHSWIASIVGASFGPFYMVIIFIPTSHSVHMLFDTFTGLSLNIGVIMYTIFFFQQKQLPKINRYSFLVLSILAVTYSVIIGIAYVIGGDFNVISQRLGSNLLFLLTFLIFLIQGIGIMLYLKRKSR